jgi:hypothetical protein
MLELPSAANRLDRNRLPNRTMVQGGDWHDHRPVGRLVLLLPDRPAPYSDSGEPPWLRHSTFNVWGSAFGVRRSAGVVGDNMARGVSFSIFSTEPNRTNINARPVTLYARQSVTDVLTATPNAKHQTPNTKLEP